VQFGPINPNPTWQRAHNGPLSYGFKSDDLELLEEIACRAGDVHSAWRAALTVLDTLHDAGRFGALGTIRALVSIHDLLTVAGLGNFRHNACSPWYECCGSRAGLSNCHPLGQAEWNHPVLLVKIVRDLSTAGIGRRRTAIEALL
jgi:hypothetical protein